MKKTLNYTMGLMFIVPGLFILLDRMNWFSITEHVDFTGLIKFYWPFLFFVLPGLYLHLLYFVSDRKAPAILIFAGSLFSLGIFLQIAYSFALWAKIWPIFFLTFAIGLLEYYYFSEKERMVLILVVIISGISAIFLSKTLQNNDFLDYIFAAVFIVLGLVMILGNGKKVKNQT
jgi:hypothetical protein